MSKEGIMKIYEHHRIQAQKEGFTFDQFWDEVCFFTDPQNSDPESWALAGKFALRSLRESKALGL